MYTGAPRGYSVRSSLHISFGACKWLFSCCSCFLPETNHRTCLCSLNRCAFISSLTAVSVSEEVVAVSSPLYMRPGPCPALLPAAPEVWGSAPWREARTQHLSAPLLHVTRVNNGTLSHKGCLGLKATCQPHLSMAERHCVHREQPGHFSLEVPDRGLLFIPCSCCVFFHCELWMQWECCSCKVEWFLISLDLVVLRTSELYDVHPPLYHDFSRPLFLQITFLFCN